MIPRALSTHTHTHTSRIRNIESEALQLRKNGFANISDLRACLHHAIAGALWGNGAFVGAEAHERPTA